MDESNYEKEVKITLHFSGGSLYLKCSKCRKEIASYELDFPGTPEQQKIPREKLEEIKINHLQSHQND